MRSNSLYLSLRHTLSSCLTASASWCTGSASLLLGGFPPSHCHHPPSKYPGATEDCQSRSGYRMRSNAHRISPALILFSSPVHPAPAAFTQRSFSVCYLTYAAFVEAAALWNLVEYRPDLLRNVFARYSEFGRSSGGGLCPGRTCPRGISSLFWVFLSRFWMFLKRSPVSTPQNSPLCSGNQ